MSAIEDGGPAFPGGITAAMRASDDCPPTQEGMSLRDWFAGQALAGFSANPDYSSMTYADTAECVYKAADAMLEARKQPTK